MTTDLASTLAYAFLYLTVPALWIPTRWRFPLWPLPLALSLIFSFLAEHLTPAALPSILALALAVHFLKSGWKNWMRGLAAALLLIISLGLGAHLLPGFHNRNVLDAVQVSADGIPFTLYLNIDKTLVGIFIVGVLHPRVRKRSEVKDLLKQILARAPFIILVLAVLSVMLGFVRWDPKLPGILPLWAVTNLLFVCLAEEGFFRGFLQKYLNELWQDLRYGKWLALAVASLAFGVAHFAGGMTYVLLSTLAGFGYGFMYQVTGRIEASMITHFLLNLFHILLLTYPALAASSVM